MPVTFTVATHPANRVSLPQVQGADVSYTPRKFLEISCKEQAKRAGEILQSSLTDARGEPEREPELVDKISNAIPTPNGFVQTLILAYNQHHTVSIRPDDVWLTILSQFNYFVNANAELLRASFVAHDGQRELSIVEEGTRYSLDFGAMSRQMVDELEKNVSDPALRAWVLPTFTTTTQNDTTVAAMLMMATLKSYFTYTYCGIECGIPRVTLEGEKSDWESILSRLEKLKEYGLQTIAWYHLLVPVIARFVKSFEEPTSKETITFWGQVAHFEEGGSGPSHYSGWINAFCAFDQKGRWVGNKLRMDLEASEPPETLSTKEFHATYVYGTDWRGGKMQLVLDDVPFHQTDSNDIPPNYAEVPVTLNDNSKEFKCILTAGVVGTRISSSNDTTLSTEGINDTVRPLSGWWMFIARK
ncbi:hypothetical protein DFH06DRAFT_1279145 [Mycena polygramma]|nr:hypothetical protein DFH06DRAFT_1279145 [Mycena polygramma]